MIVEHVILDRDGVLNVEAPDRGWILRPEDWRWQDGAREALALLGEGRTLSVATNQSCVGRGVVERAAIDAVHQHMRAGVPFAGVFVCPHAPGDGCGCRKPEPGLLLQALENVGTPPDRAVFVGDSPTDLDAARRAGITPVLVRTGKGQDTESNPAALGVAVFDDLLSFAHFLSRGGTLTAGVGLVGEP